MKKILVDIALQRAELYEEQGNKAKAEYYLKLAIKIVEVYSKIEKGRGLNEKFKSNTKKEVRSENLQNY